jgi:thioesterase domain-containing protein
VIGAGADVGATLRKVRPGSGTRVVFFDFPGWRREADFRDLAARATGARPLYDAVPLGTDGAQVPEPTASAYARVYADAIDGAGLGRCALIGYCAGGVFAHETACELARRGAHVAAVCLFDTDPAAAADLARAFAEVAERAAGAAPGAVVAPDVVSDACAALAAGRPGDAATLLLATLEEVVDRAVGTLGLQRDDPLRAELLARYRAWSWYTVAAATATGAVYPGRVDLFWADRTHFRADWPWAAETRTWLLDETHDGVLASEAARSALAAVLDDVDGGG